MRDIVERLKQPSVNTVIPYQSLGVLCREAADEILRLRRLLAIRDERLPSAYYQDAWRDDHHDGATDWRDHPEAP